MASVGAGLSARLLVPLAWLLVVAPCLSAQTIGNLGPTSCTNCHDHQPEKAWAEKMDGPPPKGHVNALKQLEGVELIPIGANRALIALEGPHRVPGLELAVRDALERRAVHQAGRPTLEAIARILQRARLSDDVAIEERTIIVLLYKRQRRSQKR